MSSLSIRQLPRVLEKALLAEARRQGKTKTELVIQALELSLGLGPQEEKKKKIGNFFGRMSPEDYESFRRATSDFSRIEEDLWR